MAFRSLYDSVIFKKFLKIFGVGANRTYVTEIFSVWGLLAGYKQLRVTADTVLTAADNGTVVVADAAGAINVDLPLPAVGLAFAVLNIANQNVTVRVAGAVADKFVGINTVTSDNIAYSTLNEKIGAASVFAAIDVTGAGTTYKWFHMKLCANTVTTAA